MKKLEDYKKEIETCSKCGLCQSVCPIYKLTGKETIVSRGKFNLLLGLIKKDLTFSKNLEKNLSLCLHCNACEDFCPSKIKTSEIISTAMCEYKRFYPTDKLIQSYKLFRLKLIILSLIFKTYRLLHISTFVKKLKSLILKFPIFGKYLILFDKLAEINCKRKKIKTKKAQLKVLYFEGCYTKHLNPSTKYALLNTLEKNNIEVIQKRFDCCGLSYLYCGNIKKYNKLKQRNIKKLNGDYDYIVCDCATCLSALKGYNCNFSDKIIDIFELLAIIGYKQEQIKDKFTYHLPCHLRNKKENVSKFIETLGQGKYSKMNEFDVCCGFAGEFSLKHPILAQEISDKKIENIEQTNSKYVLTSCPGCIIGLNKGLINKKSKIKALNLIEFIDLNS